MEQHCIEFKRDTEKLNRSFLTGRDSHCMTMFLESDSRSILQQCLIAPLSGFCNMNGFDLHYEWKLRISFQFEY